MGKLKLGTIADEKPVRISAELSAAVHRDLIAYADVLGRATGRPVKAAQLIAPMLARFMAADRGFAKARRGSHAVKVMSEAPDVPPLEREPRSESA